MTNVPLRTSGEPGVGDDWGVTFVMLEGSGRVNCHVAATAIEDIERSERPTEQERLAIFARHRKRFEAIASDLFDAGFATRVTTKHLG